MNKSLTTIKYKTADGNEICVEVSTSVKELLEQSDRQIQTQRRQDRRYRDNVEYIDGIIDTAMLYPQENTADLVIKKESYKELYSAIGVLSELQCRRLLLYFMEDWTYSRIAEFEGVNNVTVYRSVKRALKQLNKILANSR